MPLNNYAVMLTEIDGSSVKTVKLCGFKSKYDRDFQDALRSIAPPARWKVKTILRLYADDFKR